MIEMTWEDFAKYCEEIYGTYVDWDEEFFVCPDCNEPVYKVDWEDDEGLIAGTCPVCGSHLIEEEE